VRAKAARSMAFIALKVGGFISELRRRRCSAGVRSAAQICAAPIQREINRGARLGIARIPVAHDPFRLLQYGRGAATHYTSRSLPNQMSFGGRLCSHWLFCCALLCAVLRCHPRSWLLRGRLQNWCPPPRAGVCTLVWTEIGLVRTFGEWTSVDRRGEKDMCRFPPTERARFVHPPPGSMSPKRLSRAPCICRGGGVGRPWYGTIQSKCTVSLNR
jgi:hypothetical protein